MHSDDNSVVLHQIEITTRCNFSCFYCAGRNMPQQDMPWERFQAIVDSITLPRVTISLQGEGEPSLHPQFWEMVDYVKSCDQVPYSIFNGSRVDVQRVADNFPSIAVSVDTLDAEMAERIGRHNLAKVLQNINDMIQAMGAHRIVIMTVNMGQPLDALRVWVRDTGFQRHVIQPLQPKADYGKRYLVKLPKPVARQAMSCQFVERDLMRFYTLDGLALPCAFIKDTTGIGSIGGLRQLHAAGVTPPGCLGCAHLRPKAPQTKLSE